MSSHPTERLSADPVQSLDPAQDCADRTVHKVDLLTDIPLSMAKAQLGGAVKTALKRTDSALKEFGDASLVGRVCNGDLSDVLGRVWARKDTRKEFVLAIVEASGFFEVEPQIRRKA